MAVNYGVGRIVVDNFYELELLKNIAKNNPVGRLKYYYGLLLELRPIPMII